MLHRIWYKMLGCSKRFQIYKCHVRDLHQKWVHNRDARTLRIADFDTEAASQDYILWRCKARREKLYWLWSNYDLTRKQSGVYQHLS